MVNFLVYMEQVPIRLVSDTDIEAKDNQLCLRTDQMFHILFLPQIDEPASNAAVDGQPVDYTRPVRSALFQQLNPDTPEVCNRPCPLGTVVV